MFPLLLLLACQEPSPPAAGAAPLDALQAWLDTPPEDRPRLADQAFATTPLDAGQAATAADLLWADLAATLRATRAAEVAGRVLTIEDEVEGEAVAFTMPFVCTPHGEPPARGPALFLSLHGGGATEATVNDQQWENQQDLYGAVGRPEEGLYCAPRAPTDTWNMWHQPHVDRLLDRLITDMLVFEGVDPDRVYLMGYSAGGDGVYQLAPRMADRWAAAAMSAGHPNGVGAEGLRNVPFALHVGALDDAYDRAAVAGSFGVLLDALQATDPGGYAHQVELHEGLGHWMELEDAVAFDFMTGFVRDRAPDRVVWDTSTGLHTRGDWLRVADAADLAGVARIEARVEGQVVTLWAPAGVPLQVLLSDELLDLDQPVTVQDDAGAVLFEGRVPRTVLHLAESLADREDPGAQLPGRVDVTP